MGLLKDLKDKAKGVVRKIVPKELSGIMRVAAPFVAPASLPGALALSIGGQLRSERGRINPLETVLAAAPSQPFRDFTTGMPVDVPFTDKRLDLQSTKLGEKLSFLGQDLDKFLYGTEVLGDYDKATRGILGAAGKFNPFKGSIILDKEGSPKLGNIFALLGAGLSFAQAKKAIRREGEDLGLEEDEIVNLEGQLLDNYFPGFDPTGFRPDVPGKKDGGLMRKNLREGSEGPVLPPDTTQPVNPFGPKPGDFGIEEDIPIKMASNEISIDKIEMLIKRGADNDLIKEFTGASDGVINQIRDAMERKNKAGGGIMNRMNYALGSMPTKEESGLGGLPIEADMRYTGGFMPYGAKEKADDVPARLSKNEFVFTADAVRAAGGGSVQKGAQKMYNSMKQLESMGRRMA